VEIKHAEFKPGDPCPRPCDGTLYEQAKPGLVVRVKARAPFSATIHKLQKLRCGLCGTIFTAKPPAALGTQKYDESVGSLLALLKYGAGMPFYRLANLQKGLGVPLPSSTQWEILEELKKVVEPAYHELFRFAAQGNVVYNDDTTVRILELMGKRLEKMRDPPQRTGLYTTGIISEAAGRKIALYFSANRHAGENLAKLLALRDAWRDPPIQMSDGLKHNRLEGTDTIVSNCLSHGRRRFLDLFENFPEEVRHVIDSLAEVYAVEKKAREEKLEDDARLELHQRESAPVMKKLKLWLDEQLSEKKVEPNSSLGQAIEYVTKRWDALTLFLRKPGAPLDNNICERALKKAILNRKNSMFFKTRHGAEVGDLFLSLIHTTELCGGNPFEYLNALQRNAEAVKGNPAVWMPWNYQDALRLSAPPSTGKSS
jgi:transposase